MSTIIDRPAALDASPRPCLFLSGSFADCLAGARLLVDDALPRLENLSLMTAAEAWRHGTGSTMRGFGSAAQETQHDKAGRIADFGGAYVTTTDKQHSTRSGPPTRRP